MASRRRPSTLARLTGRMTAVIAAPPEGFRQGCATPRSFTIYVFQVRQMAASQRRQSADVHGCNLSNRSLSLPCSPSYRFARAGLAGAAMDFSGSKDESVPAAPDRVPPRIAVDRATGGQLILPATDPAGGYVPYSQTVEHASADRPAGWRQYP